MQPDLQNLVSLQRADVEIARVSAALAAWPRRIAGIEATLAAARTRLQKTAQSLKDEEAARRRCESDIKDKQQKIAKYRQQIDAVQTNDHLKALQHEVSYAEVEIGRFEDAELESMERSEKLEAAKLAAEAEIAEQGVVLEREKERAREAIETGQRDLVALRAERSALRSQVAEQPLATYDRVAKARGTGLASGVGQKCSACQMMLRPQKWNELRDGALMTCESCGRLLYYDHVGKLPETAPPMEQASGSRTA